MAQQLVNFSDRVHEEGRGWTEGTEGGGEAGAGVPARDHAPETAGHQRLGAHREASGDIPLRVPELAQRRQKR